MGTEIMIYSITTHPLASGGNLTTTFPSSAPGRSMNRPPSSIVDYESYKWHFMFLLNFLTLRYKITHKDIVGL